MCDNFKEQTIVLIYIIRFIYKIFNTESMEKKKYKGRLLRHLLSAPFLWIVIIPLVILDIFLEIYHMICFPLYGIPYIKRKNYIRIDRQRLKYLDIIEKAGCMYCGYANGFFNYASAIAGKTEKYWCGIKHDKYEGFVEPAHHNEFTEYGNEEQFREKYNYKKKN